MKKSLWDFSPDCWNQPQSRVQEAVRRPEIAKIRIDRISLFIFISIRMKNNLDFERALVMATRRCLFFT